MIKLCRFLAAALLLVWLGCVITMTFFVAPPIFKNVSGAVPNAAVAGDIMEPMLRRMYRVGWVALPAAFCLVCAVYAMARRGGRAAAAACVMLALAWSIDLYAGARIARGVHEARIELREKFGGSHLAPDDHPARKRFRKLHGASMMLVVVNIGLGLGAFFCATQLLPLSREPRGAAI